MSMMPAPNLRHRGLSLGVCTFGLFFRRHDSTPPPSSFLSFVFSNLYRTHESNAAAVVTQRAPALHAMVEPTAALACGYTGLSPQSDDASTHLDFGLT
jgi:hypothetical protein